MLPSAIKQNGLILETCTTVGITCCVLLLSSYFKSAVHTDTHSQTALGILRMFGNGTTPSNPLRLTACYN